METHKNEFWLDGLLIHLLGGGYIHRELSNLIGQFECAIVLANKYSYDEETESQTTGNCKQWSNYIANLQGKKQTFKIHFKWNTIVLIKIYLICLTVNEHLDISWYYISGLAADMITVFVYSISTLVERSSWHHAHYLLCTVPCSCHSCASLACSWHSWWCFSDLVRLDDSVCRTDYAVQYSYCMWRGINSLLTHSCNANLRLTWLR